MELRVVDLVSIDFVTKDAGIPSWKRVLDALVILAVLPMVLPLALLIVIAIKLVSRGPVLFRQERIGYYGQPFIIYKFRTMHVNAATITHQAYLKDLIKSDKPMTKMDSQDPRVIRGGGILRASGLDELPQLINVLRGEMSLVGPRPCTPYEYEQYSPWHSRRLEALPGLTGLWQVSGKNKLSFERMIQLDIEYGERSSIWLDLKIMAKTFPVLVAQAREVLEKRMKRKKVAAGMATEIEATRTVRAEATPAEAARGRPDSLRHRIFRNRKDKEWQSRLVLESSDVDTGVRT